MMKLTIIRMMKLTIVPNILNAKLSLLIVVCMNCWFDRVMLVVEEVTEWLGFRQHKCKDSESDLSLALDQFVNIFLID